MNNEKQIFVVGNSRSGTTMMGRILNNHMDIFTFKELHFFGQLWSSEDQNKILSGIDGIKLFSRLLCIQEFGIFNQNNPQQFDEISKKIIEKRNLNPLEIFKIFLSHISSENQCKISCDHTPRNVFYVQEILKNFPEAKIINLVRDPRDILLSQKNKWRRRYFGASGIPIKESVRSFFNYHPITISKIWNTAINTIKDNEDSRLKTIFFENLIMNPEKNMKDICQFLEIEFDSSMLKVPNIGSSTGVDDLSKLGIDKTKLGKWKSGGLSFSELYICQKMCSENMNYLGYEYETFKFPPILTVFSLITFPIKIFISFILNLHRIKNFKDLFKKRILNR